MTARRLARTSIAAGLLASLSALLLSCGNKPPDGNVHLTVTGHGTVTVEGGMPFTCEMPTCMFTQYDPLQGAEGFVVATPASRWTLESLKINDVDVPSGVRPAPGADHADVDVVFVNNGVAVPITITGHGTVQIGADAFPCMAASCTGDDSVVADSTATVTATPEAGWTLTSLKINGAAHASGTDFVFASDAAVEAVFTEEALLCTPTTNPAGAPNVTFVNPNGGGCAGQLQYFGGSGLGGVGTCVVSGTEVLVVDSGSSDDVLRVTLPTSFTAGMHDFVISTLKGQITVHVMVSNGPASAPASMTPTTAAAGTSLVITGTDMLYASEVRLVGAAQPNTCTITARTATTVTCTVPNNVGTFTVHVANGCGGDDVPGTLTII